MSRANSTYLLFRVLAVSLPVVLLVAAELVARQLVDDSDSFVRIDSTTILEEVEVDGETFVDVSHPEVYATRKTRFRAEPVDRTFRIFSFGGSASAGFPHPPEETYTEYLQQALRDASEGYHFDVTNLAAHGWASYRVRTIFERAAAYQPDLMIIWSGNNEFLERRRYPVEGWLNALADRLRLVALVRRAIRPQESITLGSGAWKNVAKTLEPFLARQPMEMRTDPAQYDRTRTHYANSIEKMVEFADAKGIPVIVVTVPVNLSEWRPNAVMRAKDPAQQARWDASFLEGERRLLEKRPEQAVESFENCVRVNPQNADGHFMLARALSEAGRHEDAYTQYALARDLDANPFRTASTFNAEVRKVAERHANAHLVDAEGLFARATKLAAPGFDLFLDYVHPTREGNLVLARGVFDAIAEQNLLGIGLREGSFYYRENSDYIEDRDASMQLTLLWVLGMNRQDESLFEKASRLRAIPNGECDPSSPTYDRLLDAVTAHAQRVFGRSLTMRRNQILGAEPTPARKAAVSKGVQRYFDKWFRSSTRPFRGTRM